MLVFNYRLVRSQLLIGFQDTGKCTQLSCLGVPAWFTFYFVKQINSFNLSKVN